MSEIRLGLNTSKMKDQGKISELNTSSHRYQSSNTVGRMSEDRGSLAFAAGTNKNHGYESLLWNIYSTKKERDFGLTECNNSVPDLRNSMVTENDITINFDAFPNASPISTILGLAKKEPAPVLASSLEYFPQSGEVPSACSAAFHTASTKCVGLLSSTAALSFSFLKDKVSEFLPSYEQGYDIVFIMSAFILAYICYRIVADLILSLVWGCGFVMANVLGSIQKQKHQQSFLEQVLSPQCTTKRLREIRKFREMAPQAAPMNSDEGAAFLGIKTKNTANSPKKNPPKQVVSSTQSTPGVTMLSKSYSSNFGGPPKSAKDPRHYDGPLNGFGVGI